MKTEFYQIATDPEDDIKYAIFPRCSIKAMEHLYAEQGEKGKIVIPDKRTNKGKFARYTYYHRDNNGVGHFCKCKFRVELPSCDSFIIDTNYVDDLQKIVDNRKKAFGEKVNGQLIYVANDLRKIFVIDIEKIDRTNIIKKMVRDTYKDNNKKRLGKYYAVNKSLFTIYDIPESIYFCEDENEIERIQEKKFKDSIAPLF